MKEKAEMTEEGNGGEITPCSIPIVGSTSILGKQ